MHAARILLYVGDTRPRKGLQDFLAAAALVYAQRQDICLRIVCKDACTVETPIPHTLIHHPTDAELADLYATSDLFVSTSWWEGLGIPPLEAMASATPVVMTDTGGGREYARHEQNCLLVPIQQPAAVAAAILRVLEDRELARRLSANGPPTAARFDWEVVTDGLEQRLLALLEGAPHHAA
jgi:glycosyltransferase involved in cell wall biosynthesis